MAIPKYEDLGAINVLPAQQVEQGILLGRTGVHALQEVAGIGQEDIEGVAIAGPRQCICLG